MADFAAIRARAAQRKGGETVLASLLGPAPDNRDVAGLSDDRLLSTMAERVFSAGFVWRVIEQKWPGFEVAFLGFEPKRIAGFKSEVLVLGGISDEHGIVLLRPDREIEDGSAVA